MCIAIYKPAEHTLNKEILRTCFNANKDGAGFCFPDNGKMVIDKGHFNFEEFWAHYREVQKGRPMLVHFRFKTHGIINADNCHPFKIDDTHAMIHNGIIKQFPDKKGKLSDTAQFNKEILRPMFKEAPRGWLQPWGVKLLEEYIDVGNKIAILSVNGDFQIYRAHAGQWHIGCWFSNDGFRPKGNFWIQGGTQTNSTKVHTQPLAHSINAALDMSGVDDLLERLESDRVAKKNGNQNAEHDRQVEAEVIKTLATTGRAHELDAETHGSE